MKVRKITTDLSVEGFDNLLSELVELKKDFTRLNQIFLEISVEWIKERAQFHIRDTVGKTGYIPTGNLASDESFETAVGVDIGLVRNIAHYAAFVEFGTGVMGQRSPHELAADFGWVYDKNAHGENGWYYFDEAGEKHWTKGMAAHRYMYNALMDYLYQGGKEECMKKAMEKVL